MEDVPHFRCLKTRQTDETARKGYSPAATLPGCFIIIVVIGKRPKREQRLNPSVCSLKNGDFSLIGRL